MHLRLRSLAIAAVAACTVVATPAFAAELFNGGTPNNTTFRGAGDGPGQTIAVTTATTLTNIGFYSASPSGGNIKYLIFDSTGANLLFSITSAAATSSSTSLIKSPTFSFSLLAGNSYQFGIISDSTLQVGFDFPPSFLSQNGLTSVGTNTNYSNYLSPTFLGSALASIPLTLDGTQGAGVALPEPATWAMMLVGFGMVGFGLRRRAAKVTTRVAFA